MQKIRAKAPPSLTDPKTMAYRAEAEKLIQQHSQEPLTVGQLQANQTRLASFAHSSDLPGAPDARKDFAGAMREAQLSRLEAAEARNPALKGMSAEIRGVNERFSNVKKATEGSQAEMAREFSGRQGGNMGRYVGGRVGGVGGAVVGQQAIGVLRPAAVGMHAAKLKFAQGLAPLTRARLPQVEGSEEGDVARAASNSVSKFIVDEVQRAMAGGASKLSEMAPNFMAGATKAAEEGLESLGVFTFLNQQHPEMDKIREAQGQ
jgi:hypothetical protein